MTMWQYRETFRAQLHLSIGAFCEVLGITVDEYVHLMRANNTRQLPQDAGDVLRSLMLEIEKKNILAYKDKYPPETAGYFSRVKILQHLDKLYQLEHNPRKTGPITVEFHPASSCPHECPYCAFSIPRRSGSQRENFDIRLLNGLIEDLKLLDVRGITISGGGEPLSHPLIGEIINSFVKEFDTGVVTNGYGLSDDNDSDRKKELRAAILECVWCRVSVDAGSQEIYRLMHGDKPHINFDDIVHKIELLASDKIKTGSNTTLGISFLLTPYNSFDLIPAIAIFREIKGLDYFLVKPVVIDPSERINAGMVFWDERIFELLGSLKDYETESFKVISLSYKFADMLLESKSGLPFQQCYGHPFYPTIAADGSVLVCCHMLNNLLDGKDTGVYGRITEDERFIAIWNKESRWQEGESIPVSSCPHSNCKLSETNKILERLRSQKVMHRNFIN